MNRDELKLTIAKALCERVYPNCEFKPEGSIYPSIWEATQDNFCKQAEITLITLEAAGIKLVSVATLTALANACERNQTADKNVVQRLRDLYAGYPY
jgi:hypothetical protein